MPGLVRYENARPIAEGIRTVAQEVGRPCNIAILGPFGHGNLGDAAIQHTVLARLRERCASVQVYGISMNPADTVRRHHIDTFAYHTSAYVALTGSALNSHFARILGWISAGSLKYGVLARLKDGLEWRVKALQSVIDELRHVAFAARVMSKIDVLVVSGGGQLDEFWGGPWVHPYTLLKWVLLASVRGRTVLVLSVGAGTISSRVARFCLRQVLRLADYRSYRDEETRTVVSRNLGLDYRDAIVPDLAFGYPMEQVRCQRSGGITVAVGPIPYCDPEVWPRRDREAYERYVAVLVSFCRRLLRGGNRIQLVVGEIHQDRKLVERICRHLEAEIAGASRGGVEAPCITTVQELLDQLSKADFVVTSRFHGVLLAALVGKPILAISYDRKVTQLMRELGTSQYCLDIDSINEEGLYRTWIDLVRDERATRATIDMAVATCEKAVGDQFDIVARMICHQRS